MKKAIWGWYPPKYEKIKSGYRIIFNPTSFEEVIVNSETNEETTITRYNVWFEDIKSSEIKDQVQLNRFILEHIIKAYDKSPAVNEFTINDIPVWFDKETRAGLKLRFEAELALGKTDTTLWYNGISFNLTLEQAIKMLHALEIYASKCYDVTQTHLSEIKNLTVELESYDYTKDYPEKLKFT